MAGDTEQPRVTVELEPEADQPFVIHMGSTAQVEPTREEAERHVAEMVNLLDLFDVDATVRSIR
ncbi:hypothetical protein [Embleya sp. NPDC020886]|uniref:hypothetical protein n=1 Tax=Embleya sp. NPDC020886 TaxID=3363980 RepID=UPI00379B838F